MKDKVSEVDNYIFNFRLYFMKNPSHYEAFFGNVFTNEYIFYKNLKEVSSKVYDKYGSPVLSQNEIEQLLIKSKSDTIIAILKQLVKANLLFNTRFVGMNERHVGVTAHCKLIAELFLLEYRKN